MATFVFRTFSIHIFVVTTLSVRLYIDDLRFIILATISLK
jgi:hypothetical protein